MRRIVEFLAAPTRLTRAEAAGMTALWVAIWAVTYGTAVALCA